MRQGKAGTRCVAGEVSDSWQARTWSWHLSWAVLASRVPLLEFIFATRAYSPANPGLSSCWRNGPAGVFQAAPCFRAVFFVYCARRRRVTKRVIASTIAGRSARPWPAISKAAPRPTDEKSTGVPIVRADRDGYFFFNRRSRRG